MLLYAMLSQVIVEPFILGLLGKRIGFINLIDYKDSNQTLINAYKYYFLSPVKSNKRNRTT
jgi:hypothetical protein